MTIEKPRKAKKASRKRLDIKDEKCVACGEAADEYHHTRSRRSGGSDNPWNLMPLCRSDHQKIHYFGMHRFLSFYPEVKEFLVMHGWEIDEASGKWRHSKE